MKTDEKQNEWLHWVTDWMEFRQTLPGLSYFFIETWEVYSPTTKDTSANNLYPLQGLSDSEDTNFLMGSISFSLMKLTLA